MILAFLKFSHFKEENSKGENMEEKRAKRMALIVTKGGSALVLSSFHTGLDCSCDGNGSRGVFHLLRFDIAEEKDNRQGSSTNEPSHAHEDALWSQGFSGN